MRQIQKSLAKRKGFVKAGEAALKNHPQSKVFEKALYKHQAIKSWDKAVLEFFEDAKEKTKATDFKEGVLYIACLTKDLASKIKMFAQRIIYILNQLIGKDIVYALKVEI
jgi:hypothetical protein